MLAAPAQPVYQYQYTPPKLVSRAAGTLEPAGKGSVTVQVTLDVHGKVQSTRILRTTNSGDNAAALEIAQHSTYAAATRGTKAVRSIYDFVINFGQSVVSGAASQIDGMLHQSQWQQAKDAATGALAKTPNDQLVQAQLGVADAFLHDITNSATAFDKAGTIPNQYSSVAAQVYALNVENIIATAPMTALLQAQKAVQLSPADYAGYYALGLAQHANKQDSEAQTTLQKAQSLVSTANPPADSATKMKIVEAQMVVYIAQGNSAGAQQAQAQLDALDPTHQMSKKIMAYFYDQQGVALQNKKDFKGAIDMFRKAAQTDLQWAGPTEYTKAAILLANQSIPDYLGARAEADKALAIDQNFALADYVAGVALGRNYAISQSQTENDAADTYLTKAAGLATKEGNTQLASLAQTLLKNRDADAHLMAVGSMLQINPNNGGQSVGGMGSGM